MRAKNDHSGYALSTNRILKAARVGVLSLFITGLGMSWGHAQIPVFTDGFDNGTFSNSDVITGFWGAYIPSNTTITESGGKLVMTAGDAASANGVFSTNMYSAVTSDEFNFFKRPLKFEGDVSLTGQYGAAGFGLTGSVGTSYSVEDVISLSFSIYNTVSLGAKQDKPNMSSGDVRALVNNVDVGGTVTRFELTLDATNYTLVVYFQGGTGSRTFTGAHGLIAAQWGTDGKSSIQLSAVRGSGGSTGAGITVTFTVDNFKVTSLASAALFEDTFGNNNVANSSLETGIWTVTNPYTSTTSEATGSLVQTAMAADTSYVVMNASTPVQSRFNFFNQQLKVSASYTVGGTASAGWMERARLVLASSAGSSGNAGDAITVALRAQNNIGLIAKMDTPYVEPDNISNPNNKFLLAGSEAVGIYSGSDNINRFDLILNDKYYRLIAYNPGKGCGTLRFGGAHGFDRAKWGAAGDSALMLESIRTSAAAGTKTVTTWDDLRVETNSSKLLNEPYWNFTATYSTSATNTESGPFCLWIPATEPVIRGIIFIAPGDGDDCRYVANDLAMQEAARAMGFGLIGYYNTARMNLTTNNTSYIKQAVQVVLDQAAAISGRPEISNAPLCITGLSRGGFDSCFLVRNWPERVVAFVPHCGAEWNNYTLSAAAKKVPGLFMPGSTDGNGATDPYVMKTNFGWWRSQGAQVAYSPDWGVGHTMRGNQGWEATLVWMVETAKLRYPRPMVPSQTLGVIPTLLNINETSGWLGDNNSFSSSAHNTPTVTSAFMLVTPYASYSGTVSTASWMPNESSARMYRALTSTDYKTYHSAIPLYSPVRIVNPAQFSEPVVAGSSVTIEVDPREFDNTNALTSLEFYDGDTWLWTVNSGPTWQYTFTPTVGAHHLSVVATDVLGNKRDAFRAFYVVPADYAPVAYRKALSCVSGATLTGTVSAVDPEGKAVTYAITQMPANGTLSLNATTGAYTYQSTSGFGGVDTFTYTASDGTLTSDPAVVEVSVAISQVGDISTVSAAPGSNSGEITLTWSAATYAWNYYIERSTVSNSGFIQIATVSSPLVTYTDTGRTFNQTYFYRVKAMNSGSQSAYTSVVSSLPNNPYSAVGAISTFTAAPGVAAGDILLNWNAAANATAYKLEIGFASGGPFTAYATLQAPSTSYTGTGLPGGLTVYFRVTPYNPAYMGTASAVAGSVPYVPPTIDGWRYINFGDTEVYDGLSGDLDAPNGDGITNLMKCALGINLYNSSGDILVVSPTSMPYVQSQPVSGSNYLTCSFTHNKNATDLVVRVEVADDPKGPWTSLDPFLAANQVGVTDNYPSVGVETIVVKDTQPITSTNKRFMRVKVEHP